MRPHEEEEVGTVLLVVQFYEEKRAYRVVRMACHESIHTIENCHRKPSPFCGCWESSPVLYVL